MCSKSNAHAGIKHLLQNIQARNLVTFKISTFGLDARIYTLFPRTEALREVIFGQLVQDRRSSGNDVFSRMLYPLHILNAATMIHTVAQHTQFSL